MNYRTVLKPFAHASLFRAWMQILNTVLPYIALQALIVVSLVLSLPFYVTLPLSLLAGIFLVRVFIIFHDCTHLSFFSSKRGNYILGHILGILSFTPYVIWQSEHNKHHGTVGNLDKRGAGDVWTMTVEEYIKSSRWKKMSYRVFRNPIVLFVIAPFVLFGFLNRFPRSRFKDRRHYISHIITNLGIGVIAFLIIWLGGFNYYFWMQLLVLYVASVLGVWLFFIQHQFEDVYWERQEDWNHVNAAIDGSSFYKLPVVLDWLTGHIGFHHIHHLNPKIPNYYLRSSHKSTSSFSSIHTVTLFSSFKLALLKLYDEKRGKMIKFKEIRR